jgi:hypothetical protein
MLCVSLLAYILIQAYGATLVSHIATVMSWGPPFDNLEGLLHSQYSLAVVNGSDIHSQLKVRSSFEETVFGVYYLMRNLSQ